MSPTLTHSPTTHSPRVAPTDMHAIQKTSRMASEEASQDTSETPSLQSPPQNNTHDDLTAGVRRRLATALGARRYDLTFAHAVHLSVAQ
ncbi:MAG: hypothetical protein V3V20_10150, partial [Algisphaera sp.]